MYKNLKEINLRPKPFEFYTSEELWTNEHTAKEMLKYHLNENIDAASRNRKFIEKSVNWIAKHFNVDETTEIADFGCGPGLYSTSLAERGAKVTGIDFSKNSLIYAKKIASKKGLHINYIHSNYLEFDSDNKFDLIIMIMCDFCVLSPEQRDTMLSRFRKMLKSDGKILLDVYSLSFFNEKEESAVYEFNQMNGFWSVKEYFCYVNNFKYETEKVLLDKYTIVEENDIRTVYNWLQCYSVDSLKQVFIKNGLAIDEIFSNVKGNNYDADSNEFAVIASINEIDNSAE